MIAKIIDTDIILVMIDFNFQIIFSNELRSVDLDSPASDLRHCEFGQVRSPLNWALNWHRFPYVQFWVYY